MKIQESGEMYLETIYVLSAKLPFARSIDGSEYMGYSKPSISRAMGLLRNDGLILVDKNGNITLTEAGLAIAKKIYRADGVNFSAAASKTLAELTELGYGDLPVCIAKTQYSFSDNAKLTGAPTGFTMEVREVRLAAGAGFVVVICGSIMTMPGLPKKPAAVGIDVDADGKITGLF